MKEDEIDLQEELDDTRKVGVPFLEIEALLEYCRLWIDKNKYKDAIKDA